MRLNTALNCEIDKEAYALKKPDLAFRMTFYFQMHSKQTIKMQKCSSDILCHILFEWQ